MFKILGPLAVTVDGADLPLGPRKQRVLLAMLLCRPGSPVPVADLADALWAGAAPRSAADNLRLYLHRLRRLLGPDVLVGCGRDGYGVATGAPVDAHRFEQLAEAGEFAYYGGDPATARILLHRALQLWRGRPFADLDDVPALVTEAARLTEHRLSIQELRIDLDLRSGQHGGLVRELDVLVTRHPYRERLYGQLMLALYRSGRQAESLATYRRARTVLHDELGIEPHHELRDLERAILRSDAGLSGPQLNGDVRAPRPTLDQPHRPAGRR